MVAGIRHAALVGAVLSAQTACATGQVVFTHEQPPADLLIAEMDAATERVDTAVYTFTLESVSDALIRAHERGVVVRVLTDAGQSDPNTGVSDQAQRVSDLESAGVPVCLRYGVGGGIFHHKFTVVDDRSVLTGSFNYTLSANERNAEDLLHLVDPALAVRYADAFDTLWSCE